MELLFLAARFPERFGNLHPTLGQAFRAVRWRHLDMNGGSVDHNSASLGGGIFNDYYGQVNLIAGSIENNTASSPSPSGGGIYNLSTVTGNAGIVHGNTPDQIEPNGVADWMPSI